MISEFKKKIKIYVGNLKQYNNAITPYSNILCEFITEFGLKLKQEGINRYPDLITLSFWCRRNKVNELKKLKNKNCLSRGKVFHITPSNIPTNFVYSLFISLLNGNSNIVKIPSLKFKQTFIIIKVIKKLLKKNKFKNLNNFITIISYDNEDNLNKYFSSVSDARMLWGSDQTINYFKSINSYPKLLDITFPDRYSIAILNSEKVVKLNKKKLNLLTKNFYNDTYLTDQGACSSPHLILWYGKSFKKGNEYFWNSLNNFVNEKYNLPSIGVLDKYLGLHLNVTKNFKSFKSYSKKLTIINIHELNENQLKLKGKWGMFFNYNLKNNFSSIKKIINNKYQTLTYFGFNKEFLRKKFFDKKVIKGIDRIVPIGCALEIDFNWDGYNLNKFLTRQIDVR